MKKKLLIPVCLIICLLLCSCETWQEQASVNSSQNKTMTISFVNDVEEADVWIVPQTEKMLKSSVWGTPVFSKMKPGKEEACTVSDSEAGIYMIRIIDSQQALFAANDVFLDNGYSVCFKTGASKYEASIVILDENGKTAALNEKVFEGILGAK